MINAENLLLALGIKKYSSIEVNIIIDFLNSGETDCKVLLNKLVDWDYGDLLITQKWFKNLF